MGYYMNEKLNILFKIWEGPICDSEDIQIIHTSVIIRNHFVNVIKCDYRNQKQNY